MSNNQMIVKKESIFSKIKKFFKIFFGNNEYEEDDTFSEAKEIKEVVTPKIDKNIEVCIPKEIKIENRKSALNPEEQYEADKKEILELYENSKKGEIDLFEVGTEKLEKMTALLEEEIKLKKKSIEEKKKKLIA